MTLTWRWFQEADRNYSIAVWSMDRMEGSRAWLQMTLEIWQEGQGEIGQVYKEKGE